MTIAVATKAGRVTLTVERPPAPDVVVEFDPLDAMHAATVMLKHSLILLKAKEPANGQN